MRYNPHKGFLANTSTKIFLLYLVAGPIAYAVVFFVQLFHRDAGVRIARGIAAGGADLQAVYGSIWRGSSAVLGSLASTVVGIYSAFGIVLLYQDVVREGGRRFRGNRRAVRR